MRLENMNVWNSQTIDLNFLGEYLGLDLSGYTVYGGDKNDGKIVIARDNEYDAVSRGDCSCIASEYRLYQNGSITYREECSKENSLRFLFSNEGDRARFGDNFEECGISYNEFINPQAIDDLKAKLLLAALGEETDLEFYRAHNEEIGSLVDMLFPVR